MTTQGKAALGTLIKSGNGASPEVFTTIAEVNNIDGPEELLEFVEATHHQSTYREFIPTLPGVSDLPLTLNFLGDETTQGFTTAGLRKDLRDKALRHFEIVFTNGDTASFSAYVMRFKSGAPVNGLLTANATLKVSGLLTWSHS